MTLQGGRNMGKKTELIQIRLTLEEKLFIMEKSEEYRMNMSDFVKFMVLPQQIKEISSDDNEADPEIH